MRACWQGLCCLTFVLCLGLFAVAPSAADQASLRTTVEAMAAYESRISGYPGSEGASDWVEQAFQQIGLSNITREEFPVTLPVDKGSYLVVPATGERIELRGLWPNLVRTTTIAAEGLEGPVIWGGEGRYEEYNGKDVEGAIILMEFNSWNRWMQAASLGARAILFIEPEHSTWRQAEGKYSTAPLHLPRFWVEREAGLELRRRLNEEALRVRLHSRMDWETRPTWNIWGTLPGTDPQLSQENIIVEAYYDGISVVPGLAPSAETASSIAALLELARHLKANPVARPVVLVATAAHFQGQQGIVNFLDRHARVLPHYRQFLELPLDPKLFISLDLSTRTDQVGIWNNTNSYDLKRFFVPFGRRFTAYAEDVAPRQGRNPEQALVNGISPIKGMDWSTFVPGGVSVNSETALQAGLVSLAFVTVNDARFIVDTPLDVVEKVDFGNLARQSAFINEVFAQAFDDPDLFADLEDFGPVLKDELRSLLVKVRAFPRRSQVPDRLISNAVIAVGLENSSHKGVRWTRFAQTNDQGNINIPGLPLGGTAVAAYVLDDESGDLTYAPDLSERTSKFHGKGVMGGALSASIRWTTQEKLIIVFPAISKPFFRLIDPRFLKPLRGVKVMDTNGVAPRQYGLALGLGRNEAVGLVFSSKETDEGDGLKMLMDGRMMLINSQGVETEQLARGIGYRLDRDELMPTGLLAVEDMWQLNESRLRTMRKHAIENQRLNRLHERGAELIAGAKEARQEKRWDQYVAYVRAALGVTARAYPDVLGTLNDVIKGMVFFLALVIPAAFFGERLLLAASDIRWQLVGFAGLLVIIWIVISQIHPAFAIAHPLVILLAFAIMAMAVFVFLLISGRFNRHMKEYQAAQARIHETDISRIGASYTAFMLGISNMRRRKMRTGLTLLTLTLLTFTVLSFTSFNDKVRFMAFSVPQEGLYEGVLIRDRGWNSLNEPTLDFARSHFGPYGVVAPRNWYIAVDQEQKKYIDIAYQGSSIKSTGLLGLAPQEARITQVDKLMEAGTFFERADEESCLLTDEMAQNLGIGADQVGQVSVQVFGRPLLVRGIINSAAFDQLHDLDDEPLTPADFQLSSAQALGPTTTVEMSITDEENLLEIKPFVHLAPENVLIMPFQTLREVGGDLRSVAVRFEAEGGREIVEDFLLRLAITLFAGLKDPGEDHINVFSYTSMGMTSVEGMGALLIPLVIASLIVLNAMLGAVYERFREISIYSSVGLAPAHIAMLFIAEACVYAVIGVTLGYILGQGLGKVLIWLNLIQGMNLNYSSISAITSALVVMAVVLMSTIYPARVAARTAVPDTVRRWTPPPPDGDRWDFEFPFMVSEPEVLGMCGFLGNYFNAYSEESIGDFYAEKVGIVSEEGPRGPEYAVRMLVWLAPFDMGVSQYMQLEFVPSNIPRVYAIEVFIQRISGQDTFWQRINHRFMNRLRKEFLIWHTMDDASRAYHQESALALAKEAAQEEAAEREQAG